MKRWMKFGCLGVLGLLGVVVLLGLLFGETEPAAEEPAAIAEVEEAAVEEGAGAEAEATAVVADPTEPPEPTATPAPTDTPEPTATPLPTPTATPLPEPVLLEGSGDSVVDIDFPHPAIAIINGNEASRFFGVRALDGNNDSIDGLVNSTDVYSGTTLLNARRITERFEVTAVGPWSIEVRPLLDAPVLEVPGSFEGAGDAVLLVLGGDPDTAVVRGNEASRFFGVRGYTSTGGSDGLVNTTDPYEGTVIVDGNTILLVVTAVGPWSIDISE